MPKTYHVHCTAKDTLYGQGAPFFMPSAKKINLEHLTDTERHRMALYSALAVLEGVAFYSQTCEVWVEEQNEHGHSREVNRFTVTSHKPGNEVEQE